MKLSKADSDIVWDKVWKAQALSGDQLQEALERDLSIMRWGLFQNVLRRRFENLNGITAVELGAGRGTGSLQLALAGAEVTLVDWSDEALITAKELWRVWREDHCGMKVKFCSEWLVNT